MAASAMTERTLTFAKPANAAKTLAKIVHVDWGGEWPLIQRVEDGQHVFHHSFRVRPLPRCRFSASSSVAQVRDSLFAWLRFSRRPSKLCSPIMARR